MAAAVIRATVNKPRTAARAPLRLSPIRCRLPEMIMTTMRKGAAAIPLTPATRTSSVIGLTEVR
jgi:hypothetical protein